MIEDDSLWQEFLAESEEHLDQLEALLGAGTADRAAVDRLFRGFHSLKGMSDALGAAGMKGLAHRCEDILGLARQGGVVVGGGVADALLAAVDMLRRQRAALAERRADTAAPAALLDRLGALASGEAVAAAPMAMEPEAGGDPLLASFASLLAGEAAVLARLGCGRDAAAARVAAGLAAAAGPLGLHRLAATLAGLAEGGEEGLPLLGRLRRQAMLLEAAAGEPAGAAALVVADAGLLAPRLAGLAAALAGLVGGGGDDRAGMQAATAAEAALALDLPLAEALLRRVEDLADRTLDPDAAALLAAEGPGLVEALRQASEGGAAAIRALGAAPRTAGEAELALPAALAEFLPVLGPEGRRRVAAALAGGIGLYRLRLAMGRPAAEEEAAGIWLAEAGEVLTSRSLLDRLPPQLDLLLATRLAPEALRAGLAAADPGQTAVLGLEPVDVATPAAPVAAAPATMRVRQDTIDGIIALEAEVRAAALALSELLREAGAGGALARLGSLERRLGGSAARELAGALDTLRGVQAQLERTEGRLSLSLRQLDEAVMELRVVPLATLFQRLPRVVRATAESSGKQVELVLAGEAVTLDRSLVELLADPLLHLTRNAVDHGIEPPAERVALGKPARAVLRVQAERRGGQVWLEVADDGRGIDRAAVLRKAVERGLVAPGEAAGLSAGQVQALLFRPGFSTRDAVTETSGRGVGLDVVQDAVRRAGGALELLSEPGAGTRFILTLPLTAAVQAVLLVEVGGHPYALPAGRVEAVLEAGAAPPGQEVLDLAGLLGLPGGGSGGGGGGGVVVVRSRGVSFGLAVDRVQRRTDLLLRPLHPALAAMPGVGGVGVLGNGDPVVVLEPDGLVAR